MGDDLDCILRVLINRSINQNSSGDSGAIATFLILTEQSGFRVGTETFLVTSICLVKEKVVTFFWSSEEEIEKEE